MSTLVVYRSISGFTKKYATWIAEELNADLIDARKVNLEKIKQYKTIIFGGSLHAVGINGVKIIKDNLKDLADKNLIVFVVGASPAKEGVLKEIGSHNFTEEEQRSIRLFYLRGGFDYDKLDLSNKVLMALFKFKLDLKKDKTADEKGMLAAYSKPLDSTRKENVRELIEYVQKINVDS